MSDSGRSALLVARQPARRRRIALALERQGVAVVGELGGPDEALAIVEQSEPAVLVVELSGATDDRDLLARNERVLELVRGARELVPGLRVIAVTESLDPTMVARAVAKGVDAYILESDDL